MKIYQNQKNMLGTEINIKTLRNLVTNLTKF